MTKANPLHIVIFAIIITMLTIQSAAANATELPNGVNVGDLAPDFRLKNVDGRYLHLAATTDVAGLIVIFTCNHCPYSIIYEDRIIELHRKFADEGYPVVAINPNDSMMQPEDSFEKMQERAREKEFLFPYLLDETQSTAKAYGARRTPQVFLLRKGRKGFTVEYIGAIDDSPTNSENAKERYVEDTIEALLNNSQIASTNVKAIGCIIKWRKPQ